ncbi:hypothetical protein CBX96_08560 [Shewanella sp. BC20]|uniref:hypothetical protein n=1 Tax=Shewanella sp. BC20 TaxID=2004459 RepID=UPI000D656E3B|nr:hypothetical protein [Shewanella sp. BC20]PWF63875.1 hypothetical protein CBX96_08560 [Shewanella sp. BC20]
MSVKLLKNSFLQRYKMCFFAKQRAVWGPQPMGGSVPEMQKTEKCSLLANAVNYCLEQSLTALVDLNDEVQDALNKGVSPATRISSLSGDFRNRRIIKPDRLWLA